MITLPGQFEFLSDAWLEEARVHHASGSDAHTAPAMITVDGVSNGDDNAVISFIAPDALVTGSSSIRLSPRQALSTPAVEVWPPDEESTQPPSDATIRLKRD